MSKPQNYDQMIDWFGRSLQPADSEFVVGFSDHASLHVTPVYEVTIGSNFLGHVWLRDGKYQATSSRNPTVVRDGTFPELISWLYDQLGLTQSATPVGVDVPNA